MNVWGTLQLKKRTLLFALLLLTAMQGCKQADFYEKEALSELTSPGDNVSGGVVVTPGDSNSSGDTPPGDGQSNPGGSNGGGTVVTNPPTTGGGTGDNPGTDSGTGTTPGGTDGSNGGSNGGGTVVTNPPVVTEPPVVVTPPVVTPPVITEPPAPVVTLIDKSETFTQNSKKNGDVDVLWVMDNSGSMGDEQDALAYNFDAFLSEFLKKDIDFQMAITTTDGTTGRNGKQIGNYKLLNAVEAKKNPYVFTNHFKQWIKVGTQGSGREQGLKTSAAFMDRYQAEFLRQDAYLVVVVISDEEDQSEKKVQEYLDRLLLTKKNPGLVKIYSIVTKKIENRQWETIGKRYLEATALTGGKSADIHEEFHSVLQDMGGSIVNLVDNFALANSPYQNKIKVYVDGVLVNSGFSFDQVSRVVKFDKSNVPREGAKIEIKYQIASGMQLLSKN